MQIADEVPESSGSDSRQGPGGFRRRRVQMPDEVPEGSGSSGWFRCR